MGQSVEVKTDTIVLREEPLDPSLFEIAAGLREVPAFSPAWSQAKPTVAQRNPSGGWRFLQVRAPDPRHRYPVEEWWLQANCDGTLVEQGARGQTPGVGYTLILKLKGNEEDGRPYQGSYWMRASLTARLEGERVGMYIFGERKKGLTEGDPGP